MGGIDRHKNIVTRMQVKILAAGYAAATGLAGADVMRILEDSAQNHGRATFLHENIIAPAGMGFTSVW